MVNVHDASYVYQVNDIELPRLNDNLKIDRHYSSRSRHSGIFGFGWCSSFETKLRILSEDSAALDECGQSGARLFRRNPKTLQWKLENGGNHERLLAAGPYLIDYLDSHPRYVFSRSKGVLISMIDSKNRALSLTYDRLGRLRTVEAGGRPQLFFDFNADSKRLDRIRLVTHHEVVFEFAHSDLRRVLTTGGESFIYQYDSFHNLIQINDSRQILQKIRYDQIQDRVLFVEDSFGCQQALNYNRDGKLHVFTNSIVTCSERLISESRYDFWYRPLPSHDFHKQSAGQYLSTFTVVREREKKTVNFRPNGESINQIQERLQ